MHRESKLIGASHEPGAGLSPPLQRAVTFRNMPPAQGGSPYGRTTAPVADEAERLLGELEDAQALVFASGMTAWTALGLSVLRPGRALAVPDAGYYGFETLAQTLFEPWGVEVRRYRIADMDGLRRAADGAVLALTETPANPRMDVVDIGAAAEAVHAGGALLVCDNTTATPLLQRPLDLGADICVQSATKSLAGHSDAMAGVITLRDAELAELGAARARRDGDGAGAGSGLAADPRAAHAGGARATRLRHRARPGRAAARPPCCDAGELPRSARPPRPCGCGRPDAGRLRQPALVRAGRPEQAEAVERSVQLIHPATSLGSVESLMEYRARIEPQGSVPQGLLRLAVGLEHPDDLWADLAQALDAAG